LIQKLNSQAEADEQEAKKILEDLTAEEKALQAEIDKAQAEYDKALTEMVAAENYVPPTEDQFRSEIDTNNRNDPTTLYGNYLINERGAAMGQAYQAAIDQEAEILRAQYKEQQRKLKQANEYFALGLIPPSATDQQRIQFVDAIDNAEKEKWAGLKIRKSRVDLMKIHQALARAHNAFQLANKDTILKARYGKKVITDRWEIKEVGKKYLQFGSPTNKNPRDGKVMRTFYPVEDYAEKPYDRMYYIYNPETGEWDQQDLLSGFKSPPAANTNTPEFPWHSDGPQLVFFTRDGVFPNLPWLRTRWETYKSTTHWTPYEGEGNRMNTDVRDNEFVAYFKGGDDKRIGRFNQKRGYSRCKPGYWFYESIPEEASQCVYMGYSMVDTNFSYYPASTGFSYEQNRPVDDYEYYKETYGAEANDAYSKAVQAYQTAAENKVTTVEEALEVIKTSDNQDVAALIKEPIKEEDIKKNPFVTDVVGSQNSLAVQELISWGQRQ